MAADDNQLPPEGADESNAPRREASAQFEVAATVAAEVAMRQAMDPANQSLGEALRLSYRLLQVAIVGLLITFLFSGFQTVQEGMSGVRTIFFSTSFSATLSPRPSMSSAPRMAK